MEYTLDIILFISIVFKKIVFQFLFFQNIEDNIFLKSTISVSKSYYLLLCWCSLCRGVGCIFYEMACGRPLFPGSTVEEELRLIFRVLGSPPEDAWGGAAAPYAVPHSPAPLISWAPRLDCDAFDLLTKFLCVSVDQYFNYNYEYKHINYLKI